MTRFPRFKLADDGARFSAGSAVLTPALARAEAIAWFAEQEAAGLVEGLDGFKDSLGRGALGWSIAIASTGSCNPI